MTPKTLIIVALLLVVIGVGLGFFWPFGRDADRIQLPGVVEVQEIRLGSKIGGRVGEVLVQEGWRVKPNQVLIRFETPELLTQKAQWEARVAQARAELDKALKGPRPEEIDAAKAAAQAAQFRLNRLQAGWREEERRQAQAEWDMSEADLRLARAEFERVQEARRGGGLAITPSEYDAKRAARDAAQGRAVAAKARAEMLQKGSRDEDIAEAQAEWQRHQANYKLLKAGTREEDKALARARLAEAQARLDEIEANLREAEVRAPEDAVIELLAVRKGDIVSPNQPVIRILRTEDMWVKVYIPETELGKIREGDEAQVTVDAYPALRFTGKIYFIQNESEFTPRNIQSIDERRHQVFGIKVRIDDPQGVFKSGMAAQVQLPLHPP